MNKIMIKSSIENNNELNKNIQNPGGPTADKLTQFNSSFSPLINDGMEHQNPAVYSPTAIFMFFTLP